MTPVNGANEKCYGRSPGGGISLGGFSNGSNSGSTSGSDGSSGSSGSICGIISGSLPGEGISSGLLCFLCFPIQFLIVLFAVGFVSPALNGCVDAKYGIERANTEEGGEDQHAANHQQCRCESFNQKVIDVQKYNYNACYGPENSVEPTDILFHKKYLSH